MSRDLRQSVSSLTTIDVKKEDLIVGFDLNDRRQLAVESSAGQSKNCPQKGSRNSFINLGERVVLFRQSTFAE